MTDKYTTLEAAAKAAPSKDWRFENQEDGLDWGACHTVMNEHDICIHMREWGDEPMIAQYIAAANPSVILGLISELRALRGLVEKQHEALQLSEYARAEGSATFDAITAYNEWKKGAE